MKATTLLIASSCLLSAALARAQGSPEDYRRADGLLPWNVEKLIDAANVDAAFIAAGDRFWYRSSAPDGSVRFMLVDPAAGSRAPAFDQTKLATALAAAGGPRHDPQKLPLRSLEFAADGKSIRFVIEEASWSCDLGAYVCTKGKYAPAAGHELASPDGKWVAYVADSNVFARSTVTGEVVQLSKDGEEGYDYGREDYWPDFLLTDEDVPRKAAISAIWSPDSRRLFTYRTAVRKAKQTYVLQSVVPKQGMRTIMHAHPYPLPGDTDLPTLEPVVFDVVQRTQINIAAQPLLEPLMSYRLPRGFWSKDGRKVYFIDLMRGYQTGYLVEADAQTGQARRLIEERSSTLVDHNVLALAIIDGGREILWASERDDWNHLYLYDGKTGRPKRQVTRGAWPVREIVHVDEKNRILYFIAGGREPGEDPYYRKLYRIGLDGSGLTLLTGENASHSITMSPTGRFFVDTYSRVNTAPVTVLRRSSDGKVVLELERTNLDKLLATGWRFPEPFTAKARDGRTDLYGIIFRPTNFDPQRKYPVIENIYSGPHGFNTPKHFPTRFWEIRAFFTSQSVAELGFVVVMMDGLGQNHRGKRFRDHQYRNLADAGLPDRVGAIKQLAARYPYLDTSRVGIFGFSAGGYAAMRAMLSHPEFYKVAVASAGNHDHRMDKLSWNETWMGHPVGPHYEEQSNITDAAKLQGKVLLTYGDLDTNVPPASTLKLVHALMEADKNFDLLVFPNRGHYLDSDPYFIRRRWDYFVEHLLGVQPPTYSISKPAREESEF